MSITDTLLATIKGDDGTKVVSTVSTETGTTRHAVDVDLAASTTNQLVTIAWTVANTQSIMILATQAVTLKVNSSGSPTETISLIANVPLIWRASAGYYTNKFATNVTAWYLTNTAACNLQASILTT